MVNDPKAKSSTSSRPAAPEGALAARWSAIEAALLRRAGPRSPALLVDFARAFHFGTPLAYFAGRSDDSLADELLSAYDFVEGRAHREIRARIIPGPHPSSTVVQATMRDQPFLLDTVREVIRAEGISIHRYLHPLLRTERGDGSRLHAVRPRTGQGTMESFLHFEVERIDDPAGAARIDAEIREALGEAALAAEDYRQMRGAAESVARALAAERPPDADFRAELYEAADFLWWLVKGNFIFLGYRAYQIEERGGRKLLAVAPRSGLGILRDPSKSRFREPVPIEDLDPEGRERLYRRTFPIIARTNRESHVHRRARMDSIGIKMLSPAGEVIGEHLFLGFFTAQALNAAASEIPVLRRRLAGILRRAQVVEGSHDHKTMGAIFDGLPKVDLFTTDEEEIGRTIRAVMEMQGEEGIRVMVRRDDLGLGVAAMVILPRDRFNSDVRRRIQSAFAVLFGAPPVDYRLALAEEHFARLHFYFQLPRGALLPSPDVLEREVRRAVRTWDDELREELESRFGDEGAALASRFFGVLPSSYSARFRPEKAVDDVRTFDDLGRSGGVRVRIEEGEPRGGEPTTLIRLYRADSNFYLSDVVPILANLGIRAIDELTFHIDRPLARAVYLHTIRVQDGRAMATAGGAPAPAAVDPARWPDLSEAILALLDGRHENDALGALVLGGLTIRQVELLRSFAHFFRQLRVPFAATSIASSLVAHPEASRALVAHFEARFRPGEPADRRQESVARARAEALRLLEGIEDLTGYRVLKGLFEVIEAMVRTNYFQKGGTLPRISFKVRSALISAMPRPVPLFEIFVHSADMEGVHLRSGKVARGGIRWSDRRDDFRTEVLGLMRTQVVKNAVIVPVGSKGGFVLTLPGALASGKVPRTGERPSRAHVEAAYRTLIAGLLDITDTLAGSGVAHPPDTVIHDGPDPYLVVAADKGTASFSDLANSIAAEYGFWLGDAFASGGSRGYDHKVEGITARGAWECAKVHLRELGIDPEGEVSVAGIGDMSGDVFGNGLILSRRFRLLAAFDHRHIFIDPSPDPASSHEERKRLFDLPGSSWADYDQARISPGGGVHRRDAKRVVLSPEARALLGVSAEALTGEELVREVLRLPVDLLWNGGIGTYVKASAETNAEAGDSRNDQVRIDATELRARVVAEGGNLGFTQAGRIEYALRGGRINTDFIDNSAGVDLSDHEVNIKIALEEAIRAGRLAAADRDDLLRSMTGEVCGQVLMNNRDHAVILSLEERLSREDLADATTLVRGLTEAGLFQARFERFPEVAELARRAAGALGLARPELAVLLAFSKIETAHALRESPLVETPGFEGYLSGYFPAPVRDRFGDFLARHPLRREIAVAALTNELAARMGIAFVSRMRADLGISVEDAVRAYRAADLLLGGETFAGRIPDLYAGGEVPPPAGQDLLLAYREACGEAARWLLRFWPQAHGGGPASAAEAVELFAPPIREVVAWLGGADAGDGPLAAGVASREKALLAAGAPRDLARRAAHLDLERKAPLVAAAARRAGVEPARAAASYFAVRRALQFEAIETAARTMAAASIEDRSAARAVIAEMESTIAGLAAGLASAASGAEDPGRAAEGHFAARGEALAAYRRALPEAGRPFGLGSLLVLADRLRRLAG
jgi:glutamate dehydrogenase